MLINTYFDDSNVSWFSDFSKRFVICIMFVLVCCLLLEFVKFGILTL